MNRIKKYFSSLKLNKKITLLIIITIFVPVVILSTLFFRNIKDSRIKEKKKNIEMNFEQNYAEIQKKVEVCIMSTQVIINSQSFWNELSDFNSSEKVDISDLLYFYRNDVASLEKIVNSNPYLYQIRVYVDSEKLPEMMPILYHKKRMERLSWGKKDFASGTWQFDYEDRIFPVYISQPKERLVSYVTKIEDYNDTLDATIEVSTRMNSMFPDMYSTSDEEWTCFIDENGQFYYDTEADSKWLDYAKKIYSDNQDVEQGYSEESVINRTPVIICHKPLKELKGHLIKIVSIEEEIASVNRSRNIFGLCFLVIFVALIFFLNKIVKIVLKQFYAVVSTVRIVQKGNLDVRVARCGTDEIGELGQQINKMLDRITLLMNESIKREVLVKDSEIRALQNQINAHFIYNVLESIKMMAEIDELYEISDAVTSLGKLLRYSMKWVSKNVTVAEEIEYIKNYLSLVNLRFDYEIYLSLNIPEIILSQEIPKMSLQPIIENAIYHGIEGIAEDTNIYMKGLIYDDYCTIEITDAGRGMSEEEIIVLQKKIEGEIETTGSSGNGIGLKNVQDRIKISFGSNYGISIASKKDCYTKVIVKIPLIR